MKKILLLITVLFFDAAIIYAQQQTTTGVWKRKADFGGVARNGAVGFSIGNKGYIGTGFYGNEGYLKDFWEYDPATDIWIRKADFPGNARQFGSGFSIGNKGYIGLGHDSTVYYADFWEYDPATDKWTRIADFAGGGRNAATGFSIEGKGYIVAGLSFDNHKDCWEYDPVADKWTQKTDFGGEPRSISIGFSIGNKGYVGTGLGDFGNKYLKDFWEYDPASDTWTQKANLPLERSSGACFSIGDKGYIGTGYDFQDELKDFWEYDPVTNAWVQKTDMEVGRSSAVGFSIGGKGYIGTGYGITGFAKDFWEFTPGENPCNAPSGLNVSNITDTSARLQWSPPASSVRGFQIVYRPVNAGEWIKKWRPAARDHIILKELLPNTTYKWAVRSICGKDSSLSEWVKGANFTTSSVFASNQKYGTLHISPNPVTGNVLNLRIASSSATSIHVSISDIQGKTFINQKLELSNSVLNKAIDVSALPKGIYILKVINSNNELQQIKFVKAN